MSVPAVAFERDLEVVHATSRVEPVRPGWGPEAKIERNLRALPGAKKESPEELERQYRDWLSLARNEAQRAVVAASLSPTSPAAWSRAAFAQANAEEPEAARDSALRAIELALAQDAGADHLDLPALTAAIKVLVGLGENQASSEVAAKLGAHPELRGLQAELLVGLDDPEQALTLLDPLPDSTYASLAGYLWLRNDQPQRAIRLLRQALVQNERDAAAWVNLSLALRELGSIRKALRAAAAAVTVSPGRLEAEHTYLDLLWVAGKVEVLKQEVQRLEAQGVNMTPEILIAKSRVAIHSGKVNEVGFLLRQAERLASEAGQTQLAAELRGNQTMISFASKQLDRSAARAKIANALEAAPDSVALADMLATLSYYPEEAEALLPLVSRHREDSSTLAFSLRARAAYISGDWENCLAEVARWIEKYPADDDAVTTQLSVAGHVDGDWVRAAATARYAVKQHRLTVLLANQAAYALALGGDPDAAFDVLERAPEWNYRLEATKGLAHLSRGAVEQGLHCYANAAKMIRPDDDADDRALLRLHLSMGLRAFGLWDAELAQTVVANDLDLLTLPHDWQRTPAFSVLARRAALSGWPWPLPRAKAAHVQKA